MKTSRDHFGFSLVEVLVAVALIGVLVFLALPNIVQVKSDSETHLAIARAEALNMSMASFVQAQGTATATTAWTGNDEAKYTLVKPYLAFAPATLALYTPGGFGLTFPASVAPLTKVTLTKGGTALSY
jgi:prepilin-type N-terminal cleavage/methylation domain-containing protein